MSHLEGSPRPESASTPEPAPPEPASRADVHAVFDLLGALTERLTNSHVAVAPRDTPPGDPARIYPYVGAVSLRPRES